MPLLACVRAGLVMPFSERPQVERKELEELSSLVGGEACAALDSVWASRDLHFSGQVLGSPVSFSVLMHFVQRVLHFLEFLSQLGFVSVPRNVNRWSFQNQSPGKRNWDLGFIPTLEPNLVSNRNVKAKNGVACLLGQQKRTDLGHIAGTARPIHRKRDVQPLPQTFGHFR